MSLINDALRRAKQAQQETPAPPATPVPHFRPVEPAPQTARHGLGLILPICLAAIALLSLLLLWELTKRDSSSASWQPKTPLSVAARSLPSPDAPVDNLDSRAQGSNSLAVANTTTGEGGSAAPAPQAVPAVANTNSPSVVADGGGTNRAAVAEPSPLALAPLKLQGIVFNPSRPSALINGRVVFVGERIREYRIMSIHQDNVVLAAAGRTNLLSLDP
jgi:hypothetical protein